MSGGQDLNGDGFADAVIGFPDLAKVLLFFGGQYGLEVPPISLHAEGGKFGASVSLLEDVNGDGFSDFLIGDPEYLNEDRSRGRVHLYFGQDKAPFYKPADMTIHGQRETDGLR